MDSDSYGNLANGSDEEDIAENASFNLKPLDISQFKIEKVIGKGDISTFFTIKEKESDHQFMAKAFSIKAEDLDHMKDFYKEVEFLNTISKFDPLFIIRFKGYSLESINNKSEFCPIIITEYACNGSLYELLEHERTGRGSDGWDFTKKLMFIYGIAHGMAFLHSKKIVHRDLKPLNILVDENLLPVISNFELSIDEDILLHESTPEQVGTPAYMAPEILESMKYTKSVDVFSFACIVYEIITGLPLYDHKINMFKLINDKIKGLRPKIDNFVPESYQNLIQRCWDGDPEKRPSFDEIVTLLKTDKGFIFDDVDEDEFLDFIDSVDEQTKGNDKSGDVLIGEGGDDSSSDIPKNRHQFNFKKVHIEYTDTNELLIDSDPIDISLFKKIEFVGKGQFGKVYKVKEKKTGNYFAAKINIKALELCKKSEITNLAREITILSKLNSPAILKYIGFSYSNFKNKPKPTIITEFSANKSLDQIIELQTRGLTPEEWTLTKMLISIYGIASGMSYLHSKGILHRDLKPANVFYDKYLFPKIGDFGLSKEIGSETPENMSEPYQIGTPAFMSPEILKDSKYCKASDVYAFAFLLYEMITIDIPYKGFNFLQVGNYVVSGKRPPLNDIPDSYRKLIERCWAQEEKDRPTFEEIVDLLENDDEFISDEINEDEFRDYVEYIKNSKINDSFHPVTVDFEKLKKDQEKDPALNISFLELNQYKKVKIIKRIDNFKIYDIVNKETNQHYEAKVSTVRITNLSKKEIIHLQREINILSKLDHPSFLRFIGYSPIDFNQQPNPIIVTEMPYNQSLNDLLNVERNETHIDEWNDTKKLINIYGIASGMAYLHSNNVIHRNLCPESIFLDDFLFPKIGNFGLLTKIHTTASMTYQTTIGIKGTPSYSSPELLESNEYSKKSDVYAFALIVYEIMTLETPFKSISNFNNLFNEIVKKSIRPKLDKNIPNCYRQIIELCWSQNPEDRPTFEEIASILKNEKGFITKNVNEEEFKQYIKFIEKSKTDFYSKNRVVNFDDIINSKDKHQLNDSTLSKSYRKTMVKKFNNIYDDLLNRKSVGSINSEVKNCLLQNSESISASPISSDFKVIIGKSSSDTDFILIKTIEETLADEEKIKKMISLYQVINNLNHPCIAKSLGYFTSDDESPSFLFEYYSHKLRNVVESIDDIYLVTLVCEICHAMMLVHSKKLIHRNLNIENIFVDSSNHAKIFGFENSILIGVNGQINTLNEKPCCMSRELLKNQRFDEKVDSFSFGVIMEFILRRGRGPFLKKDEIIDGKNARIKKSLNKLAFSIIKKCLSHSPNERPSFKAIFQTIKRNNFNLINNIEDKIPLIKDHLKLVFGTKVSSK